MSRPKTRVKPHLFQPGPADELDTNGRGACQACHLLGEPGDAHHTVPDVEPDARSAAAGERSEG